MTCAASGGKVTSLIFCCCCLFNFQFPPGVTQRVHMCERRAYLYLLQLLWWEQSDNIGVITCGWNDIIICALYYVFFLLVLGGIIFLPVSWEVIDSKQSVTYLRAVTWKQFRYNETTEPKWENPIMVLCLLWGIISLCGCCFSLLYSGNL